ncbi:MAG: hypothetical protein ACXV7G_10245 [Halobacteriota archaeon]
MTRVLSLRSPLTVIRFRAHFSLMCNDSLTVDELLLEIADYKSNDREVAVEKLKRLCSQSYEAYSYLQDRVHDVWLPERARRHMRHMLLHVRMRLHAFQEYGRTYPEV